MIKVGFLKIQQQSPLFKRFSGIVSRRLHIFFWGDLVKKLKKYIYPVVFPLTFLILYAVFLILLSNVFSFPNGSYAPAALAVLFLLAWLAIALPIYGIRYSKIIIEEKFKFLFCAYNSLFNIVPYTLPFDLRGETRLIVYLVLWTLVWNFLPLVCRIISRKEIERDAKKEAQK